MHQSKLKTRLCSIATLLGFAAALVASASLASKASAQSGTRGTPQRNAPAASGSEAGSGTKAQAAPTGLQGYCPVCVVEMKKWVKGSTQFAAQHDGKTYLFPGEEQRQMFLKNPQKYTPALGGDCVVALVEMGKRIPGKLNFGVMHDGRLYLFANEKAKNMFLADHRKYADADLALGGKCTVCRVEMNQDVLGSPEFTSVFRGMRYQFPGQKQQEMFNQNPEKYRVRE
jgi:YHS domain-containing protein